MAHHGITLELTPLKPPAAHYWPRNHPCLQTSYPQAQRLGGREGVDEEVCAAVHVGARSAIEVMT